MEGASHAMLLFLVLITVANCHFVVPAKKGWLNRFLGSKKVVSVLGIYPKTSLGDKK